jgi:hypothetical protein
MDVCATKTTNTIQLSKNSQLSPGERFAWGTRRKAFTNFRTTQSGWQKE